MLEAEARAVSAGRPAGFRIGPAQHILVFLVVTLTALAGCFGPNSSSDSSPDGPGADGGTPTDNVPPEVVVTGCRASLSSFQVLAQEVQARLPPGYRVRPSQAPGTATVALHAHRCTEALIGNETRIRDFGWTTVHSWVLVNKSLSQGADSQTYLFELFVSNDTVRDLWASSGLRVRLAELPFEETPSGARASVEVDGRPWYDLTATPGETADFTASYVLRRHQLSDDGRNLWLDENSTGTYPANTGPALIETHDGFLNSLQVAAGGAIPAESVIGSASDAFRFGGWPS